ncbi:hypothetical protein B0H13DRAFT_2384530 [Mycena leptocephala]|nr:hypothetical protein B0H13DRAFT_2384530 [Mycena leptocephala]
MSHSIHPRVLPASFLHVSPPHACLNGQRVRTRAFAHRVYILPQTSFANAAALALAPIPSLATPCVPSSPTRHFYDAVQIPTHWDTRLASIHIHLPAAYHTHIPIHTRRTLPRTELPIHSPSHVYVHPRQRPQQHCQSHIHRRRFRSHGVFLPDFSHLTPESAPNSSLRYFG